MLNIIFCNNNTTTSPSTTESRFLVTHSEGSDSPKEIPDVSSNLSRPPLLPSLTTCTLHLLDPNSVLQYITSCPYKIPTATKSKRTSKLPTLSQLSDLPPSSTTQTIPNTPTSSYSEPSSCTFSQVYPKLDLLRSTTSSSSTNLYYKDKDSDSTASTTVPRHAYNLRSLY